MTLKSANIQSFRQLFSHYSLISIFCSLCSINLPYPAEHPQNSHCPKFALFPSQHSPDNTKNGRLALKHSTSLPSTAASATNDLVVAEKIKGFPHRREIVDVLRNSERKPSQWHGHSFHQVNSVSSSVLFFYVFKYNEHVCHFHDATNVYYSDNQMIKT